MTNVYLRLTEEFNQGKTRAVISSGQAAVLHRVAIMSKDGDWILRENEECAGHVLDVLARHGARYRFGAPLDPSWLAGGWSSHFEFLEAGLRVRTDFVSRPPRVAPERLAELWRLQDGRRIPVVDPPLLADLKKTDREKDYAVIGELARLMSHPKDQFLYSRSARDLIRLADEHPEICAELARTRLVLGTIPQGPGPLEAALDAERRALMHANEERLARYRMAAAPWAAVWTEVAREISELPLRDAHRIMAERADGILPPFMTGE